MACRGLPPSVHVLSTPRAPWFPHPLTCVRSTMPISCDPRQVVDQLISWRERSGVTTRMVTVRVGGSATMLNFMSSIFSRFTLDRFDVTSRRLGCHPATAAVIGSNFIFYQPGPRRPVDRNGTVLNVARIGQTTYAREGSAQKG